MNILVVDLKCSTSLWMISYYRRMPCLQPTSCRHHWGNCLLVLAMIVLAWILPIISKHVDFFYFLYVTN